MPSKDQTEPVTDGASSFATRRAANEAREAAGEPPLFAPGHRQSFRAGFDAETPLLVVTNVRA